MRRFPSPEQSKTGNSKKQVLTPCLLPLPLPALYFFWNSALYIKHIFILLPFQISSEIWKMTYIHINIYRYIYQKLWLVLFWRRYLLFLFINIGIITFVSVILNKIKIIFTPIYLRCCKIPKGYSSNSSNINDYVNIVEITSNLHYTRIA